MKKWIWTVMAAGIAFTLWACGAPSPAPMENKKSGQEEKETTAVSAGKEEISEWPSGNVQVSVPYKVGGGVDKIARMVCAELEKTTGKSFVITNKPEGNGIIAVNELASQEPDGYNLMVISNRDLFGHIVNQIEGVQYDKDSFTYIATLLEGADSLLARKDRFNGFDDMIAYAKENPGKLTIATSNNTGLQTLTMICEKLGIEVSGVAYSSGADAFADLLGGHVDGAMVALSFYAQGKENGIIPVLTMTTEKFPVDDLDVPCVADYDAAEAASPMLRFLMGPAGMEQELVEAIVARLDQIYAEDGALCGNIKEQYDSPNYKTGEELSDFVNENFRLRQEQAAQ